MSLRQLTRSIGDQQTVCMRYKGAAELIEVIGAVEMFQESSPRHACNPTIYFLYSHCALRPAFPHEQIQSSSGLSESCPKSADVPKSPFQTVAALVPSAGTITLRIELYPAGTIEHPFAIASART